MCPRVYCVAVTRSLVLCVCFVDRCLYFCTSFGHFVVCSSIYGFLITPLVSSNSSLLIHYFGTYMYISYIFAINTLSRVCCYGVNSYVLCTDLIKQLNLLSKYLSWMPREKRKKTKTNVKFCFYHHESFHDLKEF
jgi:hypothetical protein